MGFDTYDNLHSMKKKYFETEIQTSFEHVQCTCDEYQILNPTIHKTHKSIIDKHS